jgi:nitrogen fixation NifU-like protein
MKYSAILLEHFYHPQNVGVFEDSEENVGRAIVGSHENGALIHFQIKAIDQIIVAAKFRAYGTGPTISACSYATQWLEHKSLAEGKLLTNVELIKELSIPDLQVHCSLLVEDAVKKAIADLINNCAIG